MCEAAAAPEEGNGTQDRTLREKISEHVLWYLSRALLILTLAMVALFLKIPIEHALQRDFYSELEQRYRDLELKKLDLRSALMAGAKEFVVRYEDLTKTFNTDDPEKARTNKRINSLARRSRSALNKLRSRFDDRTLSLDREFDDWAFAVISRGDEELSRLEQLVQANNNGLELTFQASRELLQSYLRRMEQRDVALRSRLRSP